MARPTLRIEWPYDPEDDVTRTAEADHFFAAWVNQFGVIEWTCTDEMDDSPEFAPLVDLMDEPD